MTKAGDQADRRLQVQGSVYLPVCIGAPRAGLLVHHLLGVPAGPVRVGSPGAGFESPVGCRGSLKSLG